MRHATPALAAPAFALLLAACVGGAPRGAGEETGPGYPPRMGVVEASLGGRAARYETFDFSVGAFDASAQFRNEPAADGTITSGGRVRLVLWAYPDGDPKARKGILAIAAVFPGLPAGAARSRDVTVELRTDGDSGGRRLLSKGPARLELLSITRDADQGGAYGRGTGRVSATLCEAVGDALVPGGACQDFSARFDTALQFDL